MQRTIITAITSSALALSASGALGETDWPTRTVNVIIGASPGGDTDFNARTMARYFEEITGTSMVITNMPGGGATIATSEVRNAEPDGYTMLFGHTGHLIVAEVSGWPTTASTISKSAAFRLLIRALFSSPAVSRGLPVLRMW